MRPAAAFGTALGSGESATDREYSLRDTDEQLSLRDNNESGQDFSRAESRFQP